MDISNASFCIWEASAYREPDTYLCSLVEKIALSVIERRDVDFKEAGEEGLRLYGRVHGLAGKADGSLHVTKPIDGLVFVGEEKTAYARTGAGRGKIESFSASALESIKLLAASALAGRMVGKNQGEEGEAAKSRFHPAHRRSCRETGWKTQELQSHGGNQNA